jgi:uncharacterized protein DUF1553/uncharacterized protein DUF1549
MRFQQLKYAANGRDNRAMARVATRLSAVLVTGLIVLWIASPSPSTAATSARTAHPGSSIALHILPGEVTLNTPAGPGDETRDQRLIVERVVSGRDVKEVTASARFHSSNPRVSRVSREGVVRPVGPGRSKITALVGGASASIQITVNARTAGAAQAPSFRNQVEPVLTRMGCNSGACHGAAAGKGGMKLTLRGYDPETDHAVLTRQVGGRRVSLLEPARSLMLLKPTATLSHGGGQRFPVDSPEYRVLSRWIAAGAPPPLDWDPRMLGLEVLPAAALLKPGDRQQILVRAHFSDGHVEDVTRWAKFGTSDAAVATVGDDGRAAVQGPGEAAVTVWYLSQVAFARISSPFPSPPASALGRAENSSGSVSSAIPSRTASFIDVLVDRKLRALNIPATAPCTDAEFIRRAYLDAAGILPTAEEVERFVGAARTDTAAGQEAEGQHSRHERRSCLIDSLLQRPEYVDFWAYKWSDLLLVSSRELSSLSMRAFYDWIRQSVAQNVPWDRFAREVVTASGSTLENGAANYFVLHRDPIDLTETTTQAFLGMSLTCARCHNHPMEKWTQNQYYAMANLFARVSRKSGDSGEMVIFAANSGDVRHPRTGRVLPPQPLDGQAMTSEASGDRRQHLAAWLTSPQNPYFARALVNRVWRQFMGRGLVEAEDDLRLTNPPSNEELLSALTADFVRHGFDVKRLIRAIMHSEAYQRSSSPVAGNEEDQKYYSHYIVRRLPAEVMLDALSQVTGVPTEFAGYPKGRRALQLPDSRVASYFLTVFGRPERVATCSCERRQEPSVAQALHLTNGDTINQKLSAADGVISRLLTQNVTDEEVVRRLYLSALSRLPTEEERTAILAALAAAPGGGDSSAQVARRQALEDLYWATLTGREFLFNH